MYASASGTHRPSRLVPRTYRGDVPADPPHHEERLAALLDRAHNRLPLFGDGPVAADPRHNWRRWTAEDDRVLMTAPSFEEAARRTGRTFSACVHRRNTLTRRPPGPVRFNHLAVVIVRLLAMLDAAGPGGMRFTAIQQRLGLAQAGNALTRLMRAGFIVRPALGIYVHAAHVPNLEESHHG